MPNHPILKILLVYLAPALITPLPTMAVEEAQYQLVQREGPFEIRDYAPQVVAEIEVSGSLETAGNRAFRPLFRYISGDNQPRGKIAMTAPVSQQRSGQKIAMTAPVAQRGQDEKWIVSFMMPSGYTLENLPVPDNTDIQLRTVPPSRMAVIRYSGFWSESRYQDHKEKLEAWIDQKGLKVIGEPVWARFNAPFMPWFLRRNEVQIPVAFEQDAQ